MKTRSAFMWSVIGQLLSFGIGFVGSVIVARLLSPAEMGIYVIGVAAIGLIAGLTTLGVGSYVVREPELTKEVLDTAFTINGLLALTLALAVAAVSQVSAWALGSREAGNVLLLLAVTPLFGIFTFRPATLMQRNMNLKATSLIGTGAMVVGTMVTIVTAYRGASYMAPAWGALTTALVSLFAYLIAGAEYVGFAVGLGRWRQILTFGLRMVTVSGAASMYARIADICVGRLLGLSALGLFSRASSLASQIFDNIYGTATRVVFIHLSQEYRTTGQLADSFLRSFRMITGVMWPLLMGIAVLSPVIIFQIYGAKWLPAAPVLSILMMTQVVSLFFGMNWELFVIRDETARQTTLELSRSIVSLALFVTGCLFSLEAAAFGSVVGSVFGVFMYRRHITRLSGITPEALTAAYRENTGLAIATVLPVTLLMAYERWSAHTPLPLTLAGTALGGAIWVAGLFYLRHPLVEEMAIAWRAFSCFRR